MQADLTRDTFDPLKHFARVLMQQGRVQLDADWNEQAAILLHYLRVLAADLIGPVGGPEGNVGFAIGDLNDGDFEIGPGHYYVDGILCELESTRSVTYRTQDDYPISDDNELSAQATLFIYLDVWERLITCVQDDSIREVALNGPDTAARSRVVWQVKVGSLDTRPGGDDCWAPPEPDNRGMLRAMARRNVEATDPCITPPQSRYRGAENQLYRVEIHSGGAAWSGSDDVGDFATFKWSRENASVVFPIVDLATDSTSGTTTATLEHLGRDDRFGLVEGDWVEVVDDSSVLLNLANALLVVQAIDRTNMMVTLSGLADTSTGFDPSRHPFLRRWDQREGDPDEGGLELTSDGVALVKEQTADDWLELEDGVMIQFRPLDDGQQEYRTGDYWLIPARTATGDVEWPTVTGADGKTEAAALPPDGVTHHYAPLAVMVAGTATTCRKQFNRLATADAPQFDEQFPKKPDLAPKKRTRRKKPA